MEGHICSSCGHEHHPLNTMSESGFDEEQQMFYTSYMPCENCGIIPDVEWEPIDPVEDEGIG